MGVTWTLKGELKELHRRHNLRQLGLMALRLSLLTLVSGYGFWLLALWYVQTPMPRHTIKIVHWLLIGHAVVWWLIPMQALSKTRYALSRFGSGDKHWRNWVGFSIEVNPLSDQHFVLKLWNKDRLRSTTLPLPEDARLQRLIVRYAKRFVPGLEQNDEEQAIRKDPPATPFWFAPLVFVLTAGHGVLLGAGMYYLKARWGLGGETMKNILLLGAFLHTAWIPAWLLARSEAYRRIRTRLYATAGLMSLVAILSAVITALLLVL